MSTDPRIQCTYDGIKAIKRRLLCFKNDKVGDLVEIVNYWNRFKETITDDIMSVPIILVEVESVDSIAKII